MGGSSWFRPSSLGRARSSGSCLEVPRPSSGCRLRRRLPSSPVYAIWSRRPPHEHPLLQVAAVTPVGFIICFFGGILLTAMIGGFSTALFAVEHFHRLNAYGLPANLMAMPVVSFVVMPMGMLAMLLTPLGLDVIPWKIAGFGLDIVIAIAQMVSTWAAISISADCRVGIFLWR